MPWSIKKPLVSLFVLIHLAAVLIWNLPECSFKNRTSAWCAYYLLPTGLWQYWGMFAPEPFRDTVALEGIVRDRHGMFRRFEFPRMADKPASEAFWGFRYSKLATNLSSDEMVAYREFVARYVLRRVGLTPNDYPADIELRYRVWRTPPIGEPPRDPMTPPEPMTLMTYRFPTWEEAQP